MFKGFKIGPLRLTCGWPSSRALGMKSRVYGECHYPLSSTGGFHEIFITPLLDQPLEVAGTVCHEIAHVAAGYGAGHGPKYRRVCQHVGLTKNKPTSAMPGQVLNERLAKLIDTLGPYPHSKMDPKGKVKENPVKDLTLVCPACECKVRISVKWLETAGVPTCGCGQEMVPQIKE